MAPRAASAQQSFDSPQVSTTLDPCVPVDATLFHRVLEIELGTSIDYRSEAPSEPGFTWVHVSCNELGIELRLDDGITRKSMVRVLDISRVEPASRTRLLALAVAEFVVASWVELRFADKPAVDPVGPAPSERARASAAKVVHARAELTPEPAAPRVEPDSTWELAALFRLEGWSTLSTLAPELALRLGQRPTSNFAFVLGADFGLTRVDVDLGQVELATTSALAAVLFVTRVGRVDLYAGGGGRFGFVHMNGVPGDSRLDGKSFFAPYGGPLMLARLAYRMTGTFMLLAEVEAGLVTLPVVGLSGRSTVIELNGAWVSAGLGAGWSF